MDGDDLDNDEYRTFYQQFYQHTQQQDVLLKEEMQKFGKRIYQEQIFDNSINRNSIIYLDTGTGKTFISIMLIYFYLKRAELFPDEPKKIMFLVNTIQLAEQQCVEVRRKL